MAVPRLWLMTRPAAAPPGLSLLGNHNPEVLHTPGRWRSSLRKLLPHARRWPIALPKSWAGSPSRWRTGAIEVQLHTFRQSVSLPLPDSDIVPFDSLKGQSFGVSSKKSGASVMGGLRHPTII
jgi:hypothetical protein